METKAWNSNEKSSPAPETPGGRADLKARLREEARRLGFDLFGVAPPETPPHYRHYLAWLERGFHAGMAWMAHERARTARKDPRVLLPSCRSIVVLGVRYWAPEALSPPQEERHLYGRVASYAWGRDYHRVLKKRLRKWVRFLEEVAGRKVEHRIYVDTGPLLERDLAQEAGLGWQGKNTCLIHPRKGSYFFLAEVLLDLPLDPDPPFPTDHCGSCTRCIEACPTGCILPDERMVDANRCISYLTIEHRGSIPEDLRPLMGNWVFGCDVCQMVCPWNRRFAAPEGDPDFAPRPGQAFPDLLQALQLDEDAFRRRFLGTPVLRAKREGFLRNVAVALGNSRDPRAVPALVRALRQDPSPLVREHAAWALGRIGTEEAHRALAEALAEEAHEQVQRAIRRALKGFGRMGE